MKNWSDAPREQMGGKFNGMAVGRLFDGWLVQWAGTMMIRRGMFYFWFTVSRSR